MSGGAGQIQIAAAGGPSTAISSLLTLLPTCLTISAGYTILFLDMELRGREAVPGGQRPREGTEGASPPERRRRSRPGAPALKSQ